MPLPHVGSCSPNQLAASQLHCCPAPRPATLPTVTKRHALFLTAPATCQHSPAGLPGPSGGVCNGGGWAHTGFHRVRAVHAGPAAVARFCSAAGCLHASPSSDWCTPAPGLSRGHHRASPCLRAAWCRSSSGSHHSDHDSGQHRPCTRRPSCAPHLRPAQPLLLFRGAAAVRPA